MSPLNFFKVWLAQAYEINTLQPRNKSREANTRRRTIRGTKNVGKKIDKDIQKGE